MDKEGEDEKQIDIYEIVVINNHQIKALILVVPKKAEPQNNVVKEGFKNRQKLSVTDEQGNILYSEIYDVIADIRLSRYEKKDMEYLKTFHNKKGEKILVEM